MDPQAPREGDASRLKLHIKFSGRSIPVETAANSTIKDLKSLLQTLTNVLPRGQKLIFKGKVLSDELTLASLEISDGSKIMLLASQGLHQGDGPLKREAVVLPGVRGVTDITRGKKEKTKDSVTKSQFERWKATGVIALSDCGLSVHKRYLEHEIRWILSFCCFLLVCDRAQRSSLLLISSPLNEIGAYGPALNEKGDAF